VNLHIKDSILVILVLDHNHCRPKDGSEEFDEQRDRMLSINGDDQSNQTHIDCN
jgi:hypothetical protein